MYRAVHLATMKGTPPSVAVTSDGHHGGQRSGADAPDVRMNTHFGIPFRVDYDIVPRMSTETIFQRTARGFALDTSEEAFGELRNSMDILDDVVALRERMQEDGYLYLPGFLDREQVIEARREITRRLAAAGCLHPDHDPMEAVTRPDYQNSFRADIPKDNPSMHRVLYEGRMIEFYDRFLGGPVRHYDFTWFRAVAPGEAHTTRPHCDIVYMGRGTKQLYTAWVPYSDITPEMGGLMIHEGAKWKTDKLKHYLERDVDTYCANGRHAAEIESGERTWEWDGSLSKNPVTLREKLGGRWLTAEFRMGDLLTFTMATVHTGLDNHSDRIRLSSDSRYQLASEPADERWIGVNPVLHGLGAKRGRIC